LIVGTGALASLFAARLAASGMLVTLLGTWEAAIQEFNRGGVYLQGLDGTGQSYPVRAITDPRRATGMRFALVLVKSWQTRRAAAQLETCLAENGLALTLQNGLGNREILASRLGNRRVAAGVTTMGASLLGPARVRLAGEGPVTLEPHASLGALEDVLRNAGFNVEIAKDLQALQWGKLVINAAINPLTAVLGVKNGELVAHSETREILGELAREAAAVAAAQRIELPYGDPVSAAEHVALRTARNTSSMLQDIRRGAPTEVDQINGAVVRMGNQVGVQTPFNRVLWLLVKTVQSRAEPVEELAYS
jgi:2-dehydropantoate 2-reductase